MSKKNKSKNKTVKKEVKKENKKQEVKKLDPEIIKLIKTIAVVVVIAGMVYGLTLVLTKMGVFDAGYTKPEREDAQISYEVVTVGTMFNKSDKEYYVVVDEFTDNPNQYLYSILYRYSGLEDKLSLFKLDLSDGFNAKYLGEGSNPSAQRTEDVKFSGPTLIKIKNNKNVLYIEGMENIEKELLK